MIGYDSHTVNAGGLGMVIPTPTGIGSYHYLVIKALVAINISREIAQYFALIVHTSQALMIIGTGFFEFDKQSINHSFVISLEEWTHHHVSA